VLDHDVVYTRAPDVLVMLTTLDLLVLTTLDPLVMLTKLDLLVILTKLDLLVMLTTLDLLVMLTTLDLCFTNLHVFYKLLYRLKHPIKVHVKFEESNQNCDI